jgi:hypothetical protein
MDQKKFIQIKMIKQQQRNNFKTIFLSILCFISTSSCKSEGVNPVLERGKPIDLAKVDFQKLNLDNFFAKLAYSKENIMGTDKHTNTKDEALNVKWFTLYNITDKPLLERFKRREYRVINKGEPYGDLLSIDRTAPLLSMRNPDLRSFGYWNTNEILFSSIYASSTANDKLIRIRLQTGNLHNSGLKEYNALLANLKAQNKGATFKEQPQSTGVTNYEWRAKDKVIQLNFGKSEDSNFFELAIAYLNSDTKGYLKEFGN